MQLLDTLRFRRNLRGYVEETCISVYHEWVRGLQYFVVHPHQNETSDSCGAQRYGMYMLGYESVNDFMKLFQESWRTGSHVELPETVMSYSRSQVYDAVYSDEDPADEYTYRLLVRERNWHFFDDRFVVSSLKGDDEHPALRELRNTRAVRAMLFPLMQATLAASSLSCIGIDSMWYSTNRKLFYVPEMVIQRALKIHCIRGIIHEEHWTDFQTEQFVGHDCVIKFNGDFTDAFVVKIN